MAPSGNSAAMSSTYAARLDGVRDQGARGPRVLVDLAPRRRAGERCRAAGRTPRSAGRGRRGCWCPDDAGEQVGAGVDRAVDRTGRQRRRCTGRRRSTARASWSGHQLVLVGVVDVRLEALGDRGERGGRGEPPDSGMAEAILTVPSIGALAASGSTQSSVSTAQPRAAVAAATLGGLRRVSVGRSGARRCSVGRVRRAVRCRRRSPPVASSPVRRSVAAGASVARGVVVVVVAAGGDDQRRRRTRRRAGTSSGHGLPLRSVG